MNILKAIIGLASGEVKVAKAALALLKLEARLAGSSIAPLLINIFLLFIVLISTWLGTMALLTYIFVLLLNTILGALFIILLLNLGTLFGLFKYLQFNLKSMSFEKTRAFFAGKESEQDDNIEKTITYPYREGGRDITPSTNGG